MNCKTKSLFLAALTAAAAAGTMPALTPSLFAESAEQKNPVLYTLNLKSAELAGEIKKTEGARILDENGVPVLEVKDALLSLDLPAKILAGKEVVVTGEMAQENVVFHKGRQHWETPKFMLSFKDAKGNVKYPCPVLKDGSAPWHPVGIRAKFPENLDAVKLNLGLQGVKGITHFRNVELKEVPPISVKGVAIRGKSDHSNMAYKPGEEMIFTFTVTKDSKPTTDYLIRWTRVGDDRKYESGMFTPGQPMVVKTRMDQPGFVRVLAEVCDESGSPVKKETNAWESACVFGLGASVEMEKLHEAVAEPADFDEFWNKQKAELAKVPMKVLEKKLVREENGKRVYDVKIACAGPRPVSGYLVIPKDAKEKSLPGLVIYQGYSVNGAGIPMNNDGKIAFQINAHGIENGREPDYYKNVGLNGYAFKDNENQNPETSYFKNMFLRAVRALEFVRSLPEWNGKDLEVTGGSQGGLQSLAAAGLDSTVTRCMVEVPWCCDLGGVTIGRVPGWRPKFFPALLYFDAANHAKRIKAKQVAINAGMDDYVCPPSGVSVLYHNLQVPAQLRFTQGKTHTFTPKDTDVITFRK